MSAQIIRTLASEWAELQVGFGPDLTPEVRAATRHTYYCGALAFAALLPDNADQQKTYDRLMEELADWRESLKNARL